VRRDRFAIAIDFLRTFQGESVHAIVTDSTVDRISHYADAIDRILRPGGHIFCPADMAGIRAFQSALDQEIDFRGSIIRLQSTPTRRVKKSDDLSHHAEIFRLYRKTFTGTVAQCLRTYQTGGLRRIGPTKPFSDVIREDDHDAFMVQIRRAALPLGVGTIVDPFRQMRWHGSTAKVAGQTDHVVLMESGGVVLESSRRYPSQ